MIYLDYNATSPCAPEVIEAMLPYLGAIFGNPASLHPHGREAEQAVRRATEQVAHLIGAQPEQILFTAGATESNNHAVFNAPPEGEIVITTAEHSSLYEPVKQRGAFREVAPSAEAILDAVTGNTALAALNLANHESGELLPEPERIAAKLRERGVPLHFDATQAVGKIPVDVEKLACDSMAFSAHKIYGPKGIGVLYIREPKRFRPMMVGGGQQQGLRAGTLYVPGIVGMGQAAHLSKVMPPSSPAARNRFEELIAASGVRHRIVAAEAPRLAQTSCVLFPGRNGAQLVEQLGKAGISVSSGSACSGGDPSRILAAQGFDALHAVGALRFSFGRSSTLKEAETAAETLLELIKNHQHSGVIDV